MIQAMRELLGHWSLVSWTGVTEEGRSVAHGGPAPRGDLIYLPSDRMSVQIQYDGRAPFGSLELEAGDEPARAAAYETYIAYCGRFSVPRPGLVVHHVELALHPDQPGLDKEREFTLSGDEPTLRTQAVVSEAGLASSELRWRRPAG